MNFQTDANPISATISIEGLSAFVSLPYLKQTMYAIQDLQRYTLVHL